MSLSSDTHSPTIPVRPLGIVGRALDELAQQRRLDREDRVGVQVVALLVEDVRHDRAIAGRAHDRVDVRRPPRVTSGRVEHPPRPARRRGSDRAPGAPPRRRSCRPRGCGSGRADGPPGPPASAPRRACRRRSATRRARRRRSAARRVSSTRPWTQAGVPIEPFDQPCSRRTPAAASRGRRTGRAPSTRWRRPGSRLASASTSIETPSESDQRMNSWRRSSVISPVAVRIRIAAVHSSGRQPDLG